MKKINLKKRQIKITNTGKDNWYAINKNKVKIINEMIINGKDM